MNRWMVCTAALALAAGCGAPKVIKNDNKPVAKFKFTESTARPQVYTLDAADSFATVGSIAKFKWDFGDSTLPSELTTPTTQHAFKMAGTFTITLVVADDKGTDSDPFSTSVIVPSVNNSGIKAVLTGPASGMLNTQLTFDGTGSTPAGDLTYAWDFGDPSGAGNMLSGPTQKTASHSFATAGTYRVTLTVTDSLSVSDTAELQVAVGGVGPVAVCNWTPSPALQGVPVKFDGSASTAPTGSTVSTYIWDFGDGSAMGTGAMAMHTYNVQATFKPKLKVLDSLNRVNEAPCADVVVGVPPLCTGDYSMSANPSSQSCGGLGTSTWAGNKLTITESADGGVVATELFNGSTITYTGSWTGTAFTVTGTYSTTSMGLTTDSDVVINGHFTGCSGWTGTYVEKDTVQGLGVLCTLTWNITSTQL